ncbi:hypothetical protein PUR61_14915, partial [Streptomyces sp. BE20]|nr:hypothetical protein [Streptomyces sp. BE20]
RGSVVLDGEDIVRLRTRDVAKKLGLLPQSPVAPEGLTVADLVARVFGVTERSAAIQRQQEQQLAQFTATAAGKGLKVLWFDSDTSGRASTARAIASESPRVTESTPGRMPAAVTQCTDSVGMPYANR